MGGGGGGFINKSAMKDTPREVYANWYIYFVGITVAFSGGLHGFNSSNISGILKMHDVKESFDLAQYSSTAYSDLSGWLTSIIVLGGMIGAFATAPLNDLVGRRITLFLLGLLYVVGCIIQIVTTSNINQVIGARALQGFAGGGGSVAGPMLIAEVAPKAIRGLLSGFFSLTVMFGIALGYWSNYGTILHISDDSHWQWRIPLLVQFVPGVIVCAFIFFVPESPRWLAWKGHEAKALRALVRLRRLPEDHPFVVQEYTDILGGIEAERGNSQSWVGLGKELVKDRTLARRFILVLIAQVGYNFSGGNSITYYQTTILTQVGIKGDDAYLFSGIYGLIKVLAVLLYSLYFTEHFGRRNAILLGSAINILCVTWISIYLGALSGNHAGAWVSVAAICIFALGYGLGWAPNAFSLSSELFPNSLRAKMTSICIGVQYLINFLLVRFFPNMTAGIGSDGPFIIFAVVSAAIWVYLFLALPEVKGVAIEHMAELFSGHFWTNGVRASKLNKLLRKEEAENAETFRRDDKGSTAQIEDVKDTKGESPVPGRLLSAV
ncbi:sugar porter family MFS transporter [Rhodotorula paludigena]|uniref:sugar porter family MFS transporter n=1 Tax=Rhodotorula paludigena TaxID=86838 RepID=UPI003170045F